LKLNGKVYTLRKVAFVILINILLLSSIYSQNKRIIGIMPFENAGNKKHDWVGFGIEYQLNIKLSNISAFYVPSKSMIINALKKRNALNSTINSEIVYQVGRETGINVAIVGVYKVFSNKVEVDLKFVNAFSGANIFTKTYSKGLNELFVIIDDISKSLLDLTMVNLTSQEEIIVNRRMTESIKAYENFCLAYVENEKANVKYEVVTSLFKRAIQADNKFWEAYYNLGIAYFNNKKLDLALNQFTIIIEALPNFEKPYFGRGLIYLEQKEYIKARKDFERVVKSNPNDYKGYFNLGKVAAALNESRKAKKMFNKATEINPDDPGIYFELGNIWFSQNKFADAISPYKKCIQIDPTNFEARQKLGECFYRNQVYYSAITEFTSILEVHPNDALANFMLGITYYKQAVLTDLIEAFLDLLEPDSKKPNNSTVTEKSEKAELYIKMAAAFEKAQKASSNFLEATFNLALTYHEMEQYNKALDFYQKTLNLDPYLVKAHIKTAHAYEALGQKEKALNKYKEVIDIEPAYFVKHPTLGPIHQYINILNIKLEEINETLEDNPNELKSNQTLAKIYYAQGYFGKAANIYRKILSISPKNKEAKKMLAILEKN
jgi:tetratricopeptide (TPR) repeat protein